MECKNSIYVIGAGLAGVMIAREIAKKEIYGKVIAFLDDDEAKVGTKIDGIPVLGSIEEASKLIKITHDDEALIAIPSISSERLRQLYLILKDAGFVKIKLLPALSQIIDDSAHLVQAREIDPQDLLTRTPIKIPLKSSLAYLAKKRVLITGAGGSIGSEISRQLLSGGASRLYLFGHGENSIYQIYQELKHLQEGGVGEDAVIVPVIGELKDRQYMQYIMGQLKCDVVFHVAAYKHVPMMEDNPVAAIENNVFGTKNLLDACLACNVKRFVLISTDKAVRPISVYGFSKMLDEKIVLHYANKAKEVDSDCAYMFVRFGNVLGSRGSIFPLFVSQIKKGGPITITDKKMMRFFMTIPEACSLVLQAGGVGANGKSYLLDMGEPVNIYETAKQLIRYMGYTPEKDIPIQIIGKRKGERLEEFLHSEEEDVLPTEYPKIHSLKAKEGARDFPLDEVLLSLAPYCIYDDEKKDLYRNRDSMISYIKEFLDTEKNGSF